MLILWMLEILAYVSFCLTQSPVYVGTNVGTVMGFQEHIFIDGEQKLISKFLGIPFAETTGGQNRFRKPFPKAPFNETFDARKMPAACYQQSATYEEAYNISGFSEDCLTLNIYVPHELRSNDLRPVMIWVYGGSFTNGATSAYNPEVLALFGNVIVVTINYRLGMFGFLRDPKGVFPGNQGLWDQHLAFKWVHNHIDSFFGYKDEITIFGESAGGASVIFQALYPGNKGLFKRVIAESGSALASWALSKVSKFERYFNDQGCALSSKTFAACLQAKDPVSLQSNVTDFSPVVDDDFLLASPIDIVTGNSTKTVRARTFFASLDIIIGANDKDGASLFGSYQYELNHSDLDFDISNDEFRNTIVPFIVDQSIFPEDNDTKIALENVLRFFYTNWNDPDDSVRIWKQVTDMSNDAVFFSPAWQTVDAHARLNVGNTYMYEFAVQTKTNFITSPSWMKGSNHADELQFVFGLPLQVNASMFGMDNFTYSSEKKQVSYATMAMWSNFAKSGDPNMPMNITKFTHTTWPAYDMTSQRYFRIFDQMSPASIIEGFYPKRMALWSKIIPEIKRQHGSIKTQQNSFDPSTEFVG